MAEIDVTRHASDTGHAIDAASVHRDLFALVGAFGASRLLREQQTVEETRDEHSALMMRVWFERSEVSRLLLSCAVQVRNVLEARGPDVLHSLGVSDMFVGTLFADAERLDVSTPLSVREACNKIIHASQVNLDVSQTEGLFEGYLLPHVFLYGTLRASRWKAALDVLPFVSAARRASEMAAPTAEELAYYGHHAAPGEAQ